MNSKEQQQINSENIKKENAEVNINEESIENEDNYQFGWSNYSEITNGRFAMLGLFAIILIELISQQPFLKWAGIL